MPTLSRRDALRAGAALVPVALAGCSSSCPDDGRPTPSTVLSTAAADGAVPEPTVDWPTFRGTPRNAGVVDGASLPGDPAVAWTTRLAGETPASAPVLADGVVYVLDGEGTLHALDARDGTERWRVDGGTGHPVGPPAATDDGAVVAGSEGTALAADGAVDWRTDHAATAPPLVGDAVFVPGEDALVALDTGDGRERWRATFDGPVARPALADGTLYGTAARVQALDPADGSQRWTADPGGTDAPPVVAGPVLVGNYDGLHAYDPADGSERWLYERGGGRGFDAPVATPESLYAVERVPEGPDALYALDQPDGEPSPRWCTYLSEGAVDAAGHEGPLVSMPAADGPGTDWALQSLSRERGQGGWAFHGDRRVHPPALSAGSAFLASGRTVMAIGEGGEST